MFKTNQAKPVTNPDKVLLPSKKAFTLAEVMVVLFIMTIILAAFAPLMTVRSKASSRTSPWNWAVPDSANTYFGVHPNQRVMIGQKTKGDDTSNRLTINTTGEQSHMLFKKDGTALAQLYLDSYGNMLFGGNPASVPEPTDSWGGNTALGYSALSALTSGYYNIAIGKRALMNTTTGSNNIAIGSNTLKNNTTGGVNSVLGGDAMLRNTTGNYNNAIGYYALYSNTTGSNNTSIGYQNLRNNVTGSYNTALGNEALRNSTGNYNTALGYRACYNTTSSYNTCLGANSGPNNTVTTANNVYIGNQYSNVYVYGTTELKTLIASSDARLKDIQGDYTSGLELIKKVKPVNFTFKDDTKKTPRVGVIAQDLKKVFPRAVTKGEDGFLKIRQEDMFYAMINAIKELSAKLDTIIKRLDEIVKKQKDLDARLKKLEAKQS